MPAKTQHDYAVYLFQQGFYEDAILHLDEVLHEEETAERWSDWATAHFAAGHFQDAERGFQRALKLNPDHADAAVSLGAMLLSLRRWSEAIGMFEGVLPKLEPEARSFVSTLADQCREQMAQSSPQTCGAR
jgi:tetratricopeptide (TPR) repeat protein